MNMRRPGIPVTLSLIICLFICALWARSYGYCDIIQINWPTWYEIASYRGRLFFAHGWNSSYTFPFYVSEPISGTPWAFDRPDREWFFCRVQGTYSVGYFYVGVPLWLPLAAMAMLTFAFWRRMRRMKLRSAFPVLPDFSSGNNC